MDEKYSGKWYCCVCGSGSALSFEGATLYVVQCDNCKDRRIPPKPVNERPSSA